MNLAASLLKRPTSAVNPASSSLQQCRGIRVKVLNGNLDQALAFMQRKMTSSGIERLIKVEQTLWIAYILVVHNFVGCFAEQTHHIKNSEKRVLSRKALQHKIQSQDLSRKLKQILIKKVRGL